MHAGRVGHSPGLHGPHEVLDDREEVLERLRATRAAAAPRRRVVAVLLHELTEVLPRLRLMGERLREGDHRLHLGRRRAREDPLREEAHLDELLLA